MNYNVIYNIEEMNAVAGLKDFKKVYAERLGLEGPFDITATGIIRAFFVPKIYGLAQQESITECSERGTTPKATETILISGKVKTSVQIRHPFLKISGLKRFHPDSLNRVYEKIESFKKYKQGLRRKRR